MPYSAVSMYSLRVARKAKKYIKKQVLSIVFMYSCGKAFSMFSYVVFPFLCVPDFCGQLG